MCTKFTVLIVNSCLAFIFDRHNFDALILIPLQLRKWQDFLCIPYTLEMTSL